LEELAWIEGRVAGPERSHAEHRRGCERRHGRATLNDRLAKHRLIGGLGPASNPPPEHRIELEQHDASQNP
jgi:hypothetical protein